MAEKRIIEQVASTEVYDDDWIPKDSVTQGTTKIQPSALKEYFNEGQATEADLTALSDDISLGADGTTYSSAGAAVRGQINGINSIIDETIGSVVFSGTHTYSGAGNWQTFKPDSALKMAIILPNNTENIELAILTTGAWRVLTTINDDKMHIVDIPEGITQKLMLTYRGTNSYALECIMINAGTAVITNEISKIEDDLSGVISSYGNYRDYTLSSYVNYRYSACPCKKADKAGQVVSLYIKSYSSGYTTFYIGEVDQYKLFIPRQSFDLYVETGEKEYNISDLGAYISEGEQILIKFIGQTYVLTPSGSPEADNSFYYSASGGMQLEVYGNSSKAIVFGFGYHVKESSDVSQDALIAKNANDIENLNNDVAFLQSNFNIVSDRSGNKYKMLVQNGNLALLPMNFNHVLCVGNSYTIHPTVDDAQSDYRTSLWWGHWAMAATNKDVAWTSLLQTALRQKVNTAKVTPVFGRRYETNPTTYNLNNSNTFTYWDDSQWKSLKDNLTSFSDVDCLVFFLGANYSGDNWYTLYKAMIEKFLEWFPNANIFCCSCSYFAMAEKDEAIQTVANEELATYINMVGINGKNKLGAFVKGDDNYLHQVDNSAVANHFGDYGEYLILDKLCKAMGYENNIDLYTIAYSSMTGVAFSTVSNSIMSGAIVSIFATIESGTTLNSITVTDEDGNNITVIDNGVTDYGRIFTFVMPSSNVTVSGNVS